jgi:hypothetical protein
MKSNIVGLLIFSIAGFIILGCEETVNDFSVVEFPVSLEKIEIISPAKGDKNKPGGLLKLRWLSDSSLSNVDIFLLRNGEIERILVLNQKNNGTYGWFIDEEIEESYLYKVKIVNSLQDSNFSVSEKFIIKSEDEEIIKIKP